MFSPIKNKKVYEHVVEQIQSLILDGKLKKGDKLPSERELAEELSVSRTSIREALRALDVIGLIESRQGEGNFIREKIEGSLFEPLSVMFMLNEEKREDILELRMMVEVEAAYLAAKRIKDKDAEELRYLCNMMIQSEDEKTKSKYDKELHYKITQITENYFIISLLDSISKLMESFIIYAREVILREIDNELLFMHHERICDAIIEKDSNKAAFAMRKHMELVNKYLTHK